VNQIWLAFPNSAKLLTPFLSQYYSFRSLDVARDFPEDGDRGHLTAGTCNRQLKVPDYAPRLTATLARLDGSGTHDINR
jgi:hypothetical protein